MGLRHAPVGSSVIRPPQVSSPEKRAMSVHDPKRCAPGSWQRIGGESPPRGRSSQPPRPRVMHEVLLAGSQAKPRSTKNCKTFNFCMFGTGSSLTGRIIRVDTGQVRRKPRRGASRDAIAPSTPTRTGANPGEDPLCN